MEALQTEERITNLLWTGGWDSTFRLLQLLLIQKNRVHPFYLIDADRRSTGIEIKTMRDIKRRLFEEHPYTRELLFPTHYMEIADVEPDSEISDVFQAILKDKVMGGQYDWIARFCKQSGISDIELCIHRDDKAHLAIAPFVTEYQVGSSIVHRFAETHITEREYLLFRYFIFPIFNLSKLQMAAIAEENNWTRLMDMTWFCHRPRAGRIPCGICNPCIYTIEEGLRRRIPVSSRVLRVLRRTILSSSLKRTRDGITHKLRSSLPKREHA
jgi:hypothetical protein